MATQNPQIDATLKELKRLKSEKNFDQLLLNATQAVEQYPTEAKFLDFLHYAQEHYVKEKLDSQIVDQLVEKKDYPALAAVYQKLLTILPESHDLQKRLKKVRGKIQETHKDEVKAYYTQAQTRIADMIQKGEYENAVAACNEILEQDPENKTFVKLLVKADGLLDKEMDKLLELYYKDVIPALYEEYETKQDQFIKI